MVPAEIVALLETRGAEAACERIIRLSYILNQPETACALVRSVHSVSQNGPHERALQSEFVRRLALWTASSRLTASELLDTFADSHSYSNTWNPNKGASGSA